ncbi:MAG: glycoside hydrolase [Acidimicrobiales bacterium]|nr:glycoside hydrolase [Acidimicrobiales bacterium]
MIRRGLSLLVAVGLVGAACTGTEDRTTRPTSPPPTAAGGDEPVDQIDAEGQRVIPEDEKPDLELALIWHQHQPLYPIIDGTVSRPWVRLHASKDYLDMAALVEEFPDLRLTFNLTPVLLDQLVALAGGTDDIYEAIARTPIEDLTPEQRRFMVDRFFDINSRIIDRSGRFKDLRARRDTGGGFTDQDLRDLRTLFHLGWIDPEIVDADPDLRQLRADDGGFTDDDTNLVLDAIDRLVSDVIPTHAQLWSNDQIEVITTPLAHPILPLIADTDLALEGDPGAILPRETFREYGDAQLHVERGLERATELLGRTPNGMWPGEGAVAQAIMPIFAENGVAWVATGEDVLAQSLDNGGFARDARDTVIDADTLYRPYQVETREGEVALFFRDLRLSDLIGFEYSGMDAEAAADDLMTRLDDIRSQLARQGVDSDSDRTPLVTLVIDGENAWEHYPNDGRDFLRAMYDRFTTTEWLTTTTPSAYLDAHPDDAGQLDEVFPAAWFSPNFATWIGEQEEARAWELLRLTRLDLRTAEQRGTSTPDQVAAATDVMLAAEGSDWFWWYGADQDSGDDRYFDDAYRELLGQVYDTLGEDRPRWTGVPIIPDPRVVPVSSTGEPVSVVIDGNPADFEDATTFDFTADNDVISTLAVAVDDDTLGLLFEGGYDDGMDVYLGTPRGTSRRGTTIDDRFVLGFDASHLIRWSEDDGACISSTLAPESVVDTYPRVCESVPSALSAAGLEMAIPTSLLGSLTAGDRLQVRIQTGSSLSPSAGPAESSIPDIAGFEPVREIADPKNDDYGPGSYSYPTDPVFELGSYDLLEVLAGESGEGSDADYVFSFLFDAPVLNPWSSPVGLSIQSIDVYLDYDGADGTGRAELLDGRNAELSGGVGWEAALAIEGWDRAVAIPNADGSYAENDAGLVVSVLAERGLVTVRVPKTALPTGLDLSTAGIAVAVMSQESFPTAGARRVRDVEPEASQWKIGGGDSAAGDTRVLDALYPDGGAQEADLARNLLPINAP